MFLKRLYIRNQFFYVLLFLAASFVLSFYVHSWRIVSYVLLFLAIGLCLWDIVVLYFQRPGGIQITRNYPDKLSNGDINELSLLIKSGFNLPVKARVLEEFPKQLQLREQEYELKLNAQEEKKLLIDITPKTRGTYEFGYCNVLVRYLGFFERKFIISDSLEIPCYPSFIQMRKYQLLATTDRLVEMGIKRIRRIGSTMEFDHIRDYVKGDEYKHMNWKSSAKYNKLMINQFQEEKSQPIYSFIDTGRVMRMPFKGMALLDYAINSTLVLSNAAILKQDRAGMLTFSKEVNNHIPAERNNKQIRLISEQLYAVTTAFEETEFGKLYSFSRRHINKRALIFIYTNFETLDAMNRQIEYLRMLNKSHVVVIIVFKNTELVDLARGKASTTLEIYNKVIAEKFVYEKSLIIQALHKNGLQTIYTTPQELSVNTINKYLELKARGLI